MSERIKKVSFFVLLTYIITLVFFIILETFGGASNPIVLNLLGIPMAFPLLSVIIVQKLAYRQSLKDSLGISFKLNTWLLFAILIPVIMSLIINEINIIFFDTTIFTQNAFLANIILGLTIASASAFFEELAWRGFLFNELRISGLFKTSLIIGIIWALWHIPVTIIFKYPNNPVAGTIINFVQMFIISIIITYVRDKSEAIYAPSLLHGMFNTMVLSSNMDDFKIVIIKILLGISVITIFLLFGLYKKTVQPHNRAL